MKGVFFGTPAFAAKTLAYLLDHRIDVLAVVTQPDKPRGRSGREQPSPVKQLVEEKYPHIRVYQPVKASDENFINTLSELHADLFVVVAYGQILKESLLAVPRLGCINVHASLLPKYRGAAPIQRCLMAGEKETGVTIMQMVKALDAGDILRTVKVSIGPDTTFCELEESLCEVGRECLLGVLEDFDQGNDIVSMPQDHSQATYASKVSLEDGRIDWAWSSEEVHNLVRALSPKPGAWCEIQIKGKMRRMKILQSSLDVKEGEGMPGCWVVGCGKGSLRILQVQLEGKKAMAAEAFLRGYPENIHIE